MALGLRDGLNYKGFCRLQCRKVWQDWSQRVDFHVISVTYGPRPCDWKVWYSEPSDPYAGQLWATFGRQEIHEDASFLGLDLKSKRKTIMIGNGNGNEKIAVKSAIPG
jgi:hypothetical protein